MIYNIDFIDNCLVLASAYYYKTGEYICPLSYDCERIGKSCDGCSLLCLVDSLGLLHNRLRSEAAAVLREIERGECCREE